MGGGRLKSRVGLAGKFVMVPADARVRFSPAQPGSPGAGAEESGGWMVDGSSWMRLGKQGAQLDRGSSDGGGGGRVGVEGVIGLTSPNTGMDSEEASPGGTSRLE